MDEVAHCKVSGMRSRGLHITRVVVLGLDHPHLPVFVDEGQHLQAVRICLPENNSNLNVYLLFV